MYNLTKATDTPRVLGGIKTAIGSFATIADAFAFVQAQEGVTFFYSEEDKPNDAGDCFAAFGNVAYCYTVERA